jgi:hypothetical protein
MTETSTYHAVAIQGPRDTAERLAIIVETDAPAILGSRAKAQAIAKDLRLTVDPGTRVRVVEVEVRVEWQ